MDKREVSVIVPIYNKEMYLRRCIDSLLTQTFQNIEIILVDDESTDKSGMIADEYAARDNRIRVIHQKNKGEIGARRAGVEMATSQYLTFVDADDSFSRDAIEKLYTYCTEHQLDIVFGAYRRIEPQGESLVFHPFSGIISGNDLAAYLMDLKSICLSSSFSKRTLWHDDVFLEDGIRYPSPDVLVNIKLTKYVHRAGIINDIVYNYYCVLDSLSMSGTLSLQQNLWKSYFEMLKTNLKERGLYEANEQRFHILEIERLAFYVKNIDKTDNWVKQVLKYDTTGFPLKIRILQLLIHFSYLRFILIGVNRYIKSKLRR